MSEVPSLRHFLQRLCWIVTSWAWAVVLLSVWFKRIPGQSRFETHVSFIHCERLDLIESRWNCWVGRPRRGLVLLGASCRVLLKDVPQVVLHLLFDGACGSYDRSFIFDEWFWRFPALDDRIIILRAYLVLLSYSKQIFISYNVLGVNWLLLFCVVGSYN